MKAYRLAVRIVSEHRRVADGKTLTGKAGSYVSHRMTTPPERPSGADAPRTADDACDGPGSDRDSPSESTRATRRGRIAPFLGIDPRALGAFRIGLGLVLLAELLVYRLPAVVPFYTDSGVLPRETLAATYPTLEAVSLHALSGAAWFQTTLVLVGVALAGLLLVGHRTRLALGGSALLLASLYARNPYALNGGSTVLVAFLALSLSLPLDARWSLAALRGVPGRRDVERRVCSVGTAVVLLAFVSIYAANALTKYQSDAWMAGTAVARIYRIEEFVVGLGPVIAEWTAVLTAVNWVWIALLTASPLLVLSVGRLRAGLALACLGAHLSMAATMRLGTFPFVMAAILCLYLPPRVWDAVESVVGPPADAVASTLSEAVADGPDAGGRAGSVTSLVGPRGRRAVRVTRAVLLVAALAALVGWQAAGVGLVDAPGGGGDGGLTEVSWSFFAPEPPDSSSWYVVRAELASGDAIDAVDGEPVDFEPPPDAADRYPTTVWHQYGHRLRYADERRYEAAARYFCGRLDGDVDSVTVVRVAQPIDAHGPVGDPTTRERGSATC